MNLDFFLNLVYGVGSLWWLPVPIWVIYFFWCRFLDYPADLEKHIRSGRIWPYLPKFWKRRKPIRAASLLWFWLGNLSCASSLYYLFSHRFSNKYFSFTLLIIGMVLSIFAQIKIRSLGTKNIIRLQQDRYFQIYTQLANQAISKGDEVSDSELLAKTQWQHQNDLRLADKQGRFMEFLRGEAKL
ncbi:MAG: hypothetical protein LBU89_02715 [Fibromonadaceae bacterium]|nr:hypothetical protein [Fibromonadaceae bacterium]